MDAFFLQLEFSAKWYTAGLWGAVCYNAQGHNLFKHFSVLVPLGSEVSSCRFGARFVVRERMSNTTCVGSSIDLWSFRCVSKTIVTVCVTA